MAARLKAPRFSRRLQSTQPAGPAYTVGPAHALARQGELGRLAPGQLADVVALSPEVDPARPEALWRGWVSAVVVGGEVVR